MCICMVYRVLSSCRRFVQVLFEVIIIFHVYTGLARALDKYRQRQKLPSLSTQLIPQARYAQSHNVEVASWPCHPIALAAAFAMAFSVPAKLAPVAACP